MKKEEPKFPNPSKGGLDKLIRVYAMSWPPSFDLVHTLLFVTIFCRWRGKERALDRATTSPKLKCLF